MIENQPEAMLNLKKTSYHDRICPACHFLSRRFVGMTKMPLLPIRKLPEVSSIGKVS